MCHRGAIEKLFLQVVHKGHAVGRGQLPKVQAMGLLKFKKKPAVGPAPALSPKLTLLGYKLFCAARDMRDKRLLLAS